MKKFICYSIFFIAFFSLMLWAIKTGLDKNEQAECLTWQAQAREYPLFNLSQWQKEQCDFWHITIEK